MTGDTSFTNHGSARLATGEDGWLSFGGTSVTQTDGDPSDSFVPYIRVSYDGEVFGEIVGEFGIEREGEPEAGEDSGLMQFDVHAEYQFTAGQSVSAQDRWFTGEEGAQRGDTPLDAIGSVSITSDTSMLGSTLTTEVDVAGTDPGETHDLFAFSGMLKADGAEFDFTTRNRRPPKDPVNALLSLAYSILAKDWTVTLLAVGLDPFIGLYHRPRFGRPSLALDLMEEFRPLIADSVVLQLINNGEMEPRHFAARGNAVSLTADGRKKFFQAYERRMSHEITHPLFGYRIASRRLLETQARLFVRALSGELEAYPGFCTR